MSTISLIVLIGVILLVAIAVWGFLMQRRSSRLRGKFGPEYQTAVREYGDRARAEEAYLSAENGDCRRSPQGRNPRYVAARHTREFA